MRNYLIKAAVVLGAIVLVVEGFYLYQLSQDRSATDAGTDTGTDRVAEQYNAESTSSAQGSTERSTTGLAEFAYIHRATAENISDNSTYLDNPLINGNPDAIIQATQNWNPETGDGVYNDHLTGVWYDTNAEQWAIFNQDRADMPEGAAFNVFVSEAE